ncbi:hypothetical protein B0H10DRAFT_831818 [Mycena sp. CBHHK59/15]|nr:hypothetical protein B0H10DRAFT_831818 [Mycena sp. CBHHK59/15]
MAQPHSISHAPPSIRSRLAKEPAFKPAKVYILPSTASNWTLIRVYFVGASRRVRLARPFRRHAAQSTASERSRSTSRSATDTTRTRALLNEDNMDDLEAALRELTFGDLARARILDGFSPSPSPAPSGSYRDDCVREVEHLRTAPAAVVRARHGAHAAAMRRTAPPDAERREEGRRGVLVGCPGRPPMRTLTHRSSPSRPRCKRGHSGARRWRRSCGSPARRAAA